MPRALTILTATLALLLLAPSARAQQPPPAPGVEMHPEGNPGNVRPGATPAANLWLCTTGPCGGPGEGSLRVASRAAVPGGRLGAYALVIKHDAAVVAALNPCDVVFGAAGAGAARGPVDEITPAAANADCADDAGPAAPGTCAISWFLEGIFIFSCATAGQQPGATGDFDLASLELAPHPDLVRVLTPAPGNGVSTSVTGIACKLVGVLGDGIPGTSSGLAEPCGDLAVTVRVLEGDLDLDCDVDAADAQAIAARFGAVAGSALYDPWFDLEPATRDLDIDIRDVQRVSGRIGSTCQAPVPPQPPA